MLTEDYIMRMINVAVAALVRLVGLRAAGQHQEALELINQSLEGLLGLRADLIPRLDDQALLASLTNQGHVDLDRLVVVADLFFEEGEILTAQAQTERAYWSYLRALNFYLDAALSEAVTSRMEKIDAALSRISGQQLPQETLFNLFAYFESAGSFARAAFALNQLVALPGSQEEIRSMQVDFYSRLLNLPEAKLQQGGLSRSQVVEALNRIPPKEF